MCGTAAQMSTWLLMESPWIMIFRSKAGRSIIAQANIFQNCDIQPFDIFTTPSIATQQTTYRLEDELCTRALAVLI
ncbi:protein of unknown function [Paraburkholderia dioscoreae]|uniref:Uncharacterized protein n=1 Tax=Paraburkholderia dioscoreae TaxID=2604047 RepID=A0A5Q4Z9Q0_9BURK|nr:protein of unknown function [Paraburkholderia dioscoreae]